MKTFHPGGIHPNPSKLTKGDLPTPLNRPEEYIIPLSQSLGHVAKPIVEPGQRVEANEKIAIPDGLVSAAIHTPVGGVVRKIEDVRDAQGLWQSAIVIETDKSRLEETTQPFPYKDIDLKQIQCHEVEYILDCVGEAGIVGMGGAAFPTKVKLMPPPGKSIDSVLLNGAECEPYLTCDDALMLSRPRAILYGGMMIARAVAAKRIIIGIEADKVEAIESMQVALSEMREIMTTDFGLSVGIVVMKTRYPQGSEKQLIETLTGRIVPMGGLPADTHCVVDNVATAAAVADAMEHQPLVRRIVTLTGPEFQQRGNYIVEIGMTVDFILKQLGGLPEDTGKVIAGGPMMGRAMSNVDCAAVKGLGGVLVLPESQSRRRKAKVCIRCTKCVQVCPMGLEPYLLQALSLYGRYNECKINDVMNCLECGCCSYICPSSRPLLDYIRLAKGKLKSNR